MMSFTHIDSKGNAKMVDVSEKANTLRTANAFGKIKVTKQIIRQIIDNTNKKGDVLSVARIAGISGAKKTSELIPLCHNILIHKIDLEFKIIKSKNEIEIYSFAKTNSQTGIEMEALTAVSIAALTIYDMCKAIDKGMIISEIKLLSKTGGKSDYKI